MRLRWHTCVKWGAAMAISVGLVLGGVVLALRAGWVNDGIRAYAERALSQGLGTEVVIGGLHGDPLSRFELTGVRLGAEPALQVASVTVDYHILSLLRREILVDRLALRSPRGVYRDEGAPQDSAGTAESGADPDWWVSGPAWQVRIDHAEILDGGVALLMPEFQDQVKGIHAALGVKAGPAGYELALRRFQSAVFDPPLVISNLTAVALLREGRLALDGVSLRTPASHVTVYGSVSGLSQSVYDLTLVSDSLAFEELNRALPGDYPAGKARLAGRVQGNSQMLSGDLEVVYRSMTGQASVQLDLNEEAPSYDVRVGVRDVDLAAWGIDAQFDLAARLQGLGTTLQEASGRLTVAVGRARVLGGAVDTAGLVARFQAGQVEANLAAEGDAGRLRAGASLDLRGGVPIYRVTADLAHLDLSRLPLGLDSVTDMTATVRLAHTVSGTWRAGLRMDSARVSGVSATDVRLEGTFRDGVVRLDSLGFRLTEGYGTFRGWGTANLGHLWQAAGRLPAYEMTLRLDGVDLDRLAGVNGLGKSASATAVVSGTGAGLDALRAQAEIVLDAPGFLGVGVDSARVRLTQRGRRTSVERVVVANPLMTLEGSGRVWLADSLDVRLDGRILAPGRVGEALGIGISGRPVSLTAQVGGRWTKPRGTVDLLADSLNYGGVPMTGVHLQSSWPVLRGGGLLFRARSAEWAGRTLEEVFLDASLEGEHVAFILGNSGEGRDRIYLWGSAGAHGEVYSLSLDSLFVQVEDIALSNMGPCRLVYHPERGIQMARFTLGGPAGQIEARDDPSVTGGVEAHLNAVDLRHWAFLLGYQDELSGVLDGDITLSGALMHPQVSTEFTLRDGNFSGVRFGNLTATLAYGEKRVSADVELEQTPGKKLAVTGSVPLDLTGTRDAAPEGGMRLRAKSEAFDLGFLSEIVPDVEDLSGTLAFDLSAGGSLSRPAVTGWMKLTDGKGHAVALNQTFRRVDGGLRFEPDRILVDSIRVEPRRGRLAGAGTLTVDGYEVRGLDLGLRATDFEALNRPELNMALGADLRLTGSLDAPRLDGKAMLNRAVIRLSDFIEAPPDAESIWKTWPFFVNMDASVQVSAARNVWVRDRDVNIEIEGDVDLRKSRGDFRLYGALKSRQGRYEFLTRSFKINEGEIQFQGRPEMNPDIYILGETRQRLVDGGNATLQVIVGGTLLHPQISLESDAGLSEDDMLSYLAFGRPADGMSDLLGGEGGGSLEGQARGLVLGLAANRLKQSIGERLNLDVVEIDMGEEGNVTRVRVGKYIGSKLFVTYAQDISSPGTEVTVEYELLPWLTLEAEQRPQGEGEPDRQRLGLVWKLEW